MCGRFTLTRSLLWLCRLLDLPLPEKFSPRYNIAPSQPVISFFLDPDSGRYKYDFQLWGLIPPFCKDPAAISCLINARAETVEHKPSFKNAFKYRRCIIPANGFYEWQNSAGIKQPWYFVPQPEEHFYFAGIWEVWHGPDGEQVDSCAIITTSANSLVGKIHQRMPVLIAPDDIKKWLNKETDIRSCKELLKPLPAWQMQAFKVNRLVNNPKFDNPDCIVPAQATQPELF